MKIKNLLLTGLLGVAFAETPTHEADNYRTVKQPTTATDTTQVFVRNPSTGDHEIVDGSTLGVDTNVSSVEATLDGNNDLVVTVTEDGTPISSTPLELPEGSAWDKADGTPAKQGDVAIYSDFTTHIKEGNWLEFDSTNELDTNDGKIGSRLFDRGLNIVGIDTEGTGDRWITVYGNLVNTGNVQASAFVTISDKRKKENIVETTVTGLEVVNDIDIVDFDYIDGVENQTGVIAQQVKEIYPKSIVYGDTLGVDYTKLVPVLIKAVQEQQVQIEQLKTQLD